MLLWEGPHAQVSKLSVTDTKLRVGEQITKLPQRRSLPGSLKTARCTLNHSGSSFYSDKVCYFGPSTVHYSATDHQLHWVVSRGHTLIHRKRVWYFTVSGFVLLSQLSQAAVGVLSIFIVRGLLEINARAFYSGYCSFSAMEN